jgi:two-component system nitrogen regulation sensor histidine kinase GlnL
VRSRMSATLAGIDQKKTVLVFQWLLVLVVVSFLFSGKDGVLLWSRAFTPTVVLILSNAALSLVPGRLFDRLALLGPLLIADTAFVGAAIYVSSNVTGDLFPLYFLTIFLAALSRNVKVSVLSSVVVVLLCGAITSWRADSAQLWTGAFLVRIPLFLVTGLFTGFLASQVRVKETEKQEAADFNARLRQELSSVRRAEEKAREDLTTLYRQNLNILESLATAILAVDSAVVITAFNAEASRITGISGAQILGRGVEFVPGLAPLYPLIKEAVEELKVCTRTEITLDTAYGTSIPVGVSTSIVWDSRQRPRGAIAIFKDLSELKDLERKLKRSEHLALLGEMAASVAHEIRNPLNSISGFAQLLDERIEEGDRRKQFARIVVQESKRIDRIIGDTLVFSREAPRSLDEVSLNEIAASCTVSLSARATQSSVSVSTRLDPGLPRIMGHAGQLEQLLTNLIMNAIQAMPEGGDVRVSTDCAGDCVRVTVSDTGPGIEPSMHDRVFRPFFTTKPDGTGLGLAICSKIVEDLHGNIGSENGPEGGAVFGVSFPVPRVHNTVHSRTGVSGADAPCGAASNPESQGEIA